MAVIEITEANFETEVLKSDVPVLVDFWAVWCGPCQMQGPVIDEAAEKLADKAVFGKVNVDEQQKLAQQYGVMSIPTLIVIKNGQVANKAVGFHTLEQIKQML